MKYSLLLTLLLCGCVATPVARHFPDQPESTKEACAELQLVPENTTKLSVVLDSVTTNYGQYNECKVKVETWQEWYNQQKANFDKVN